MRFLIILTITFCSSLAFANDGASSIYVKLQKLQSLKRVLYVAAHPDDENTRALAWFSLGEKAETAYFSLTRGDGGQNLIGNELSDNLGVLRTQELLAARSFDKAHQYFSKAVDFGYSKSDEESFDKWGKEALLQDLVLMIRKFKPDAIITRFPPDERGGHGHHTASAVLAIEAFAKAADPNYLKEQVAIYGIWQATSIYWNTSSWWVDDIKELVKNDPNYLSADIGGFNKQLGMSYNEIGTHARSQHKCQGFGGILERGSRIEYFEYLAGEKLKNSFFEKKSESWTGIIDADFEKELADLVEHFDFIDPEKNVPELLFILDALEKLPTSLFRDQKVEMCREIIQDCLGLYVELLGEDFAVVQGDSAYLSLNIINRSGLNLKLTKVELNNGEEVDFDEELPENKGIEKTIGTIGRNILSTPYWLENPHGDLFEVEDPKNLTQAENQPSISANVDITIEGKPFSFGVAGEYKWRDPAYGERRRPLISAPTFTATFEEALVIVKPDGEKTVRLNVHSFVDELSDELSIVAPTGWKVDKTKIPLELKGKHAEQSISITLTPLEFSERGRLTLKNANGDAVYAYTEIAYDHIPTQVILQTASISCIQLNAKIHAGKIAYVKGIDDALPQAIRQLGFELEVVEVNDLANLDLSQFQSVVLGIRIYNVHPELTNYTDKLNGYVEQGGNLIMQYNTASRAVAALSFGPVPMNIGRERVTDENAAVAFLAPDHTIMNVPNKITQEDFQGWVQERGLYFAKEWDEAYTPLFSWSDRGEDPVKGALLVLKHGKGQFIYTGISFFRELPNGVLGAYRLFANMLSYHGE
ncbi:MAG: LmbE family N-acetylglucosaminyl deacetylase [Crocinitomicaceae bacterium]|jgi:LmbE family N-acetylglucosaminyl deacetylase